MKLRLQLAMIVFAAIAANQVLGQEGREPTRNGFPKFSWDRVPVSAHFGIGEGLTSEQYDLIAKRFDFITLTAGPLPRASQGSAELFTAEAARAIKKTQSESESVVLLGQRQAEASIKNLQCRVPGRIHSPDEKRETDERTKSSSGST